MSSAESLRELIIERLTAAAEEIFGLFERTVVQYEEEIDRQRRLLDITWKPEIKLHRIDLPQQHVYTEEEVLTEEQLYNQERKSSLDQVEPEPPQINEEQKKLCSIQQEEHLVLNQETDSSMETPSDEESEHSEPEPNSDHLLSYNSPVAERPDQYGRKRVDSGSTRNSELNPKKRHHRDTSHRNNVDSSSMSESESDTDCGKTFKYKHLMERRYRFHPSQTPYHCNTCGKSFTQRSSLILHTRIHTGEKPYPCKTCGKRFTQNSDLTVHVRTHTGEKPYPCKSCGKRFSHTGALNKHVRTHTGEKPYDCNTCGKSFNQSNNFKRHMRIHTGE
ncbi:zinc finger protein ZFP2-like [Mugil cephalus]|uniref:zinc finger protein ZFP2-like n=1 Tax=Mugil cephalus TaxID=48193 RepID=UPI001FB75A94|nr:zinc finger protein ZFP2-like [Mugil cephalus]